jgi:hypothetical protein
MDNKLILIYIIVFSALLILLRIIGIISVNNNELIGYGLIIYGLSLYYSSFVAGRKLLLFLGSGLFLSGVVFLIAGSFDIQNNEQLFIPATLFVLSISSLMLFLFDRTNRTSVYASVILFAGGIGAMALVSPYGINNFFNNVIAFTKVYWPVIIILAAVVILVNRETKK